MELKGFSAATLRALWRTRHLMDATFRNDTHNRELFMSILRQPQGLTHALRRMNQHGILGAYLPAFGRIVGQMQHDLFHVYTVDQHILMVVRNLRRFTLPEFAHENPLCSKLIQEFARPEVLYIAGLFHDIAKGRGGDHSLKGRADAARFCKQHGMNREDSELVVWLVENHLTLSATAQKQDLSDQEVIAAFAAKMKNDRYLVALYLLTVADIRGTSPNVWNAWKAKLLEDLFWAARRYMAGGKIADQAARCAPPRSGAAGTVRHRPGELCIAVGAIGHGIFPAPRAARNRLAHAPARIPRQQPRTHRQGAPVTHRRRHSSHGVLPGPPVSVCEHMQLF